MLAEWRKDGYGYDVLELWSAGYPQGEDDLEEYAAGSDATCFVDDVDPQNSAFFEFDAIKDDLFVIDAEGSTRYRVNLSENDIEYKENRDYVDMKVRAVLE